MLERIKKIFALKNLLHALGIIGVTSLLLSYLSPLIHPDTSSLFPLLGLAYPIILLANLLLLIVFIILRNRWGWILGLILLLGIKLHLRIFSLSMDNDPGSQETISVMSYNVRLFGLYDTDFKEATIIRNQIFDFLTKNKTDIICFQEFYHQDPPTVFKTRDTLLHFLDFRDHHERFSRHLKSRQNFGVSIYSRFPFIRKGNVIFDNAGSSNNFCVFGDFVALGDTFRIYNAHLQSIHFKKDDYAVFEDETGDISSQSNGFLNALKKVREAFPVRAKQSEIIAEHIKGSPYPVILCGDFNDTPLSYTYNQFNSILIDAFRNCSSGLGSTYAGKTPAGRIDYIFHDASLESAHFRIQQRELSDHYAISCKIYKAKT